jgi:hypothetical protein
MAQSLHPGANSSVLPSRRPSIVRCESTTCFHQEKGS